jgi:hypothetical protein
MPLFFYLQSIYLTGYHYIKKSATLFMTQGNAFLQLLFLKIRWLMVAVVTLFICLGRVNYRLDNTECQACADDG